MRAGNTEETMPEIVVYMIEGRSMDEKRALVKDVTAAVVKNIGVPPEAVVVSLVEQPKTTKSKGGVLFSDMPAR
jgi:4-oxalocrotonate tautomerase